MIPVTGSDREALMAQARQRRRGHPANSAAPHTTFPSTIRGRPRPPPGPGGPGPGGAAAGIGGHGSSPDRVGAEPEGLAPRLVSVGRLDEPLRGRRLAVDHRVGVLDPCPYAPECSSTTLITSSYVS